MVSGVIAPGQTSWMLAGDIPVAAKSMTSMSQIVNPIVSRTRFDLPCESGTGLPPHRYNVLSAATYVSAGSEEWRSEPEATRSWALSTRRASGALAIQCMNGMLSLPLPRRDGADKK